MTNPIYARVGYSPNEAADFSSIGRTKIFALMRTGRIRAHKCGKRTIILHNELIEDLAALPLVEPCQTVEQAA